MPLNKLVALAQTNVPVIVCAEAVYWRCNRRIVADRLIARGCETIGIFDADRANEHELTRFAEIFNGCVTYPADDDRS